VRQAARAAQAAGEPPLSAEEQEEERPAEAAEEEEEPLAYLPFSQGARRAIARACQEALGQGRSPMPADVLIELLMDEESEVNAMLRTPPAALIRELKRLVTTMTYAPEVAPRWDSVEALCHAATRLARSREWTHVRSRHLLAVMPAVDRNLRKLLAKFSLEEEVLLHRLEEFEERE